MSLMVYLYFVDIFQLGERFEQTTEHFPLIYSDVYKYIFVVNI
jgi:hypothetical protein